MFEVAVASHFFCAAAFAIASFVLSLHRPTRTQFSLLVISGLATTLWGIFATLHAASLLPIHALVIISQVICYAAWYLCLIRLLKLTKRMKKTRQFLPELLRSKPVIFRSKLFLSSTIYLLSLAGFYYWGNDQQFLLFSGALISVFLMFTFMRIRAKAKRFFSKKLFKFRYDYREEWVRFSSLLFANEDNQSLSSRVIKALADLVQSPKGLLFEWEEGRGFVLKDCWNHVYPNKEIVIDSCPFTEYLQKSQKAFELPSRMGIDERSFAFTVVPQEIRLLNWAWLLVPLMQGNRLHGFVILAHPRMAFFNVNWEVLDLLSLAGRQAVICLVQEQNAQALAVARQFESYNRVSAFVMHDLKNTLAQLRLIQSNKDKHENNPAFVKSVFQTIEYNGDKIERLLLQMQSKHQGMSTQRIALASTLQKVIQLTNHRHPIPRLDWQLPSAEVMVKGEEDRFVNVLCHLVENAQQATPENGEVILVVSSKDEKLKIAVKDTGCGMDPEFLHFDLCKPFVTTKGDKGMGIGVFEAREYAHAVGGKLLVESVKGKGSTFNLEFPLLALA